MSKHKVEQEEKNLGCDSRQLKMSKAGKAPPSPPPGADNGLHRYNSTKRGWVITETIRDFDNSQQTSF